MKRTPETFAHHLANRVASCGTFYLVMRQAGVLGPEFLIVPNSCSSNYCLPCRQTNLRRLRHALIRAMAFHRWRLVTLTYAHRDVSVQAVLSKLKTSFSRLTKRIKRKFPNACYVRTVEVHTDNYPHIHMVIDKYIPVAWLQLHWKECGGGMVDIREGKRCDKCGKPRPCEHYARAKRFSHHDAAGYLTEEIEKTTQDPHRLGVDYWCAAIRSISVSRGIKLKPDTSDWKYYQKAMSWDAIEELMEAATFAAKMSDQPAPTLATRGSVAMIGPGYTQATR
jgi:hypothetical protein